MVWEPQLPPAELAETRLITAILDGTYPINTSLPAERELAGLLGVTRPTLREALQRLARDGWVDIQHGRSTRVRDYCREGNIAVLGAMARHQAQMPPDFVPNLLQVRTLLAPAYARQAVERAALSVSELTAALAALPDEAAAYAAADWELHHQLTILSGNPVFTLILNGFGDLYLEMGLRYFVRPEVRQHSRGFYAGLLEAARHADPAAAEAHTRQIMLQSQDIWQKIA